MSFLSVTRDNNIAVVTFSRGKVNAINGEVVDDFNHILEELEADNGVKGVVLTGTGKFFSFGWDVPELYALSPDDFTAFMKSFCELCRTLFVFPKPLIAAINGHAVAGGCILAIACDGRVMTDGKAKMSLNEVTFGASLFSSAIEMLRHLVGGPRAEEIVLTGQMFDPQDAYRLGLVNGVVAENDVVSVAIELAQKLAAHSGPAFASLKRLIRQPLVDAWMKREEKSISEFVKIWYSPETRQRTRNIRIL